MFYKSSPSISVLSALVYDTQHSRVFSLMFIYFFFGLPGSMRVSPRNLHWRTPPSSLSLSLLLTCPYQTGLFSCITWSNCFSPHFAITSRLFTPWVHESPPCRYLTSLQSYPASSCSCLLVVLQVSVPYKITNLTQASCTEAVLLKWMCSLHTRLISPSTSSRHQLFYISDLCQYLLHHRSSHPVNDAASTWWLELTPSWPNGITTTGGITTNGITNISKMAQLIYLLKCLTIHLNNFGVGNAVSSSSYMLDPQCCALHLVTAFQNNVCGITDRGVIAVGSQYGIYSHTSAS